MQTPMRLVVHGKPPRQLAMALDRPVLNGMTVNNRITAVRRLARMLTEAAGVAPERIATDGTRWEIPSRAADAAMPAIGARRLRSTSTASALSGET